MSENFTNLGIDLEIQNQEANRSLHNFYPKQCSTTYIIIKLSEIKDEERILIAARRKNFSCKRIPIRIYPQIRREWGDIIKVLKGKNCQQKYFTWQSCPSEGR